MVQVCNCLNGTLYGKAQAADPANKQEAKYDDIKYMITIAAEYHNLWDQ